MTYTKAVLTVIALLLSALVMRPIAVRADTEAPALYIEPGTSPIRNLNGGIAADGKIVINVSTGDVWGFPTHSAGSPYPIDSLAVDGKITAVRPVFLGKFDFSAIRRGH
ncbi:MAG: hypothetical protein ABSF22_17360 [Bryobacteraceae bacterium]